jgi:type VI secretion system protein ImpG
MNRSLYPYYEQELRFLRKDLEGFAKAYPAAAGRLLLDASQSADPHVERLIEAVALLTARVHKKIDDEFPELTDALLSVTAPHYLAPIPSLTIVGFDVDGSAANLQNGFVVPRGRRLSTRGLADACQFRTCYDVTLWPVRVESAALSAPPLPAGLTAPPGTAAALRIRLSALGDATFSSMTLQRLRLYLHGEPQLVASLYEAMFHRSIEAAFVAVDGKNKLPPISISMDECIHQVGFEPHQELLPYPPQTHPAHRLLTEFFAFPQKFSFIDVGGFDRVRAAGFGRQVEWVLFLKEYPSAIARAVDAKTFRLGCTPVVNLFAKTAEPIVVDETTHEYQVIPDAGAPRGAEVFSIDAVVAADSKSGAASECAPFYSFRHERGGASPDLFWFASRRPSPLEGDRGGDVFLSLVDLNFQPRRRGDMVLTVATTCSNRDVPAQLQRAGEQLRFELDFTAPVLQAASLRTVTPVIRPAVGRRAFWRLISQLSVNHLSLTGGADGLEAFKEILRLHDLSSDDSGGATPIVSPVIDGLVGLSSRRSVAQIGSPAASGMARGIEVVVELDEEKCVGVGVYLFASVIERVLGLYATINSFVQLSVKTKLQDGYYRRWPPRAGDRAIL